MADDYLLQAAIGALQGFSSSYVPFKQREQQDLLTQQAEKRQFQNQLDLLKAKAPIEAQARAEQFNRENYIDAGEIPSNIQEGLGLPKIGRVRKDVLTPAVQFSKQKSEVRPTKQFINKSELERRLKAGERIDANRYEIFDDTKSAGQGKGLTTEGSKTVGNLEEGIASIDRALELSKRSPLSTRIGTIGLPLLGESVGRAATVLTPGLSANDAARFSFEIKNASDVLARYRTGAAINNKELELYGGLLNDALASDEVREENLNRVMQFFKRVRDELKSGKRTLNDVGEQSFNDSEVMQNVDSTESMTDAQRETLQRLGL